MFKKIQILLQKIFASAGFPGQHQHCHNAGVIRSFQHFQPNGFTFLLGHMTQVLALEVRLLSGEAFLQVKNSTGRKWDLNPVRCSWHSHCCKRAKPFPPPFQLDNVSSFLEALYYSIGILYILTTYLHVIALLINVIVYYWWAEPTYCLAPPT